MFQISAGENTFEVTHSQGQFNIDGKPFQGDISQTGPRHFHIIHDYQSYRLEVIDINREEKTGTVRLNSDIIELKVQDKMDLLLEKLGMNNLQNVVQNNVKAPMPGLILDILVKTGDEVKKGDAVVILEAMKMENVIKASGEAVVEDVVVEKGASVEKNQIMVKFK